MLALLVALSLSQVTPDSRVTRVERVPGGRMEGGRGGVKAWAFFEAFPLGGAGTTTACSTTPPTGAKGEVLTFARTGNATCTKTATGGLATTGIANGDLVELSANQPRVEYDSAGTLGLLVESARTNSVLRSQDLANGVWFAVGAGGAAAPTVTATYATGPDNGTTATRLQVNACAGASQASVVYQNYTGTAAATVGAPFLRGTSTSGTVNVYFYDTTAGTGNAVQCSFTSDSWTRCEPVSKTFANATHRIGVGCLNDAVITGSTNTGAVDVLVYGMQSEAGTYLTSYIPTTSAAVTRNADSPAIFASTPGTVATGSMSLRVQLFTTATNGLLATDATGAWKQGIVTFGGERAYIGAVSMVGPLTALTAGTHTAAMWWDGSSTTLILDGSPTVGAAGTPVATNQVIVGGYNGTNLEPGLYSRICVDPSPTRCR